jgi:anti-sigma-K factor RskA
MRYDSPELRERLAAEYVLGTMPDRSRRRFERLIADDPEFARVVGDWADRLSPLDMAMPAEEPPEHVWRAIERRIGGKVVASPTSPWRQCINSLAFWRGLTLAGGLATAALAALLTVAPRPLQPTVIAVLGGHDGDTGWVAVTGPKPWEVSFSTVAPKPQGKPHSFELWGIAGGPPRPLGLLPEHPGEVLTLPFTELPSSGGLLAVSFEPPGGSSTGSPTGPVLYQGKVLVRTP